MLNSLLNSTSSQTFTFFSKNFKNILQLPDKNAKRSSSPKTLFAVENQAKRCCKTSCTSRRKRPYTKPVQNHLRSHNMQQMKFVDNKNASKHARQLVTRRYFAFHMQSPKHTKNTSFPDVTASFCIISSLQDYKANPVHSFQLVRIVRNSSNCDLEPHILATSTADTALVPWLQNQIPNCAATVNCFNTHTHRA